MNVPTLMYNLTGEVTCSVCMQLYTKPKQLPCLHIFCLQCLNNLTRTSAHNGKIKCPLCQRHVAVPQTGTLETLPDCFNMKNLLDILTIKECNTSKVACGNCEMKSEEASYCFHCGKFWCSDCVNAHNILRENRDHRVLALVDFEDKDFQDVLKRPVFCQKELHGKEVLKFYCKECDVPVCQTCVIIEHNKHDVEHLEVAAREVKNIITSKLDAARQSSNTINDCMKQLEEKARLLEHRSKINKERIQQAVNSLILTLRKKEQESILDVESQKMKVLEQIEKSKNELSAHLIERNHSISQIETFVQRTPAAELVRSKTNMYELCQRLPKQQDMPSTPDIRIPSTVFFKNEEISKILKESKIGHLDEVETEIELKQCSLERSKAGTVGLESQFEMITRNSKREQYHCPADLITVDISSIQSGNTAEEVEITDQKNGSYIISYIPRETGEYLLSVRVNETDRREFPVFKIKERTFTPLRCIREGTIEEKKLKHPWGIAVHDSDEIFVSDIKNNRIVVFNEYWEFVRSFGHNVLRNPTGLAVDNTGRIIVVSRKDGKILLFTPNGEYVRTICDSHSLKDPRGVALDSQGNLIVCDSGNACVRFISPQGNILKTIGKGTVVAPHNCVVHKDKIFVSDRDANLIKVYTDNGRFLYEFGRYGTMVGELNGPTGLAVDKTGNLLVCSFHNNAVQIFTLDGEFVTQFGKRGQELGQMQGPCSVSVLKSGRIVVSEFTNDRLQLFE